jgi:hypothetical protein
MAPRRAAADQAASWGSAAPMHVRQRRIIGAGEVFDPRDLAARRPIRPHPTSARPRARALRVMQLGGDACGRRLDDRHGRQPLSQRGQRKIEQHRHLGRRRAGRVRRDAQGAQARLLERFFATAFAGAQIC